MIRKRAKKGDTIRLIAPGMDTMRALPPGTVLEVVAHVAEQPHQVLVVATSVPDAPVEYVVTVPKGDTVRVVEET